MQTSTFGAVRSPIVDPKTGHPSPDFRRKLSEYETKLSNAITLLGEIAANTKIQGRTEGIGTTVGNLTATGQLSSLTKVAADVNTDHIADGTGSPLSGGKRGQIALDTNNRLANSFRANPVNVSNTPTSSTTLSNDGVSTSIPIAASTNQFPPGTVAYNSGSVDPGAFGGPNYVYADDPTFSGGALAYAFTTVVQNQTAAEGRTVFGSITTVNGTAKTGGGSSGGTGGKPGGRGFIQS